MAARERKIAMSNTSFASPQSPCLNSSNVSLCDADIYSNDDFKGTLSAIISIVVLSPVAVVGNALVLAAIWRNPSLKTPSYVLLATLAFTDFCNGFITQPFFVANMLIRLNNPLIGLYSDYGESESWPKFYLITAKIGYASLEYLFIMTMLIITFMSIERWLHMSRQHFVTVRRASIIVAVLSLLPIPLVVSAFQFTYSPVYIFSYFSLTLLCLFITSSAYFKVFKIIRCQQQQIQVIVLHQNPAQPAINLLKYKKSVFSIFFILLIFYLGYLPMALTFASAGDVRNYDTTTHRAILVSVVLAFLSSSLNPLLYLWRMKDIQTEVRQIVKQILCRES